MNGMIRQTAARQTRRSEVAASRDATAGLGYSRSDLPRASSHTSGHIVTVAVQLRYLLAYVYHSRIEHLVFFQCLRQQPNGSNGKKHAGPERHLSDLAGPVVDSDKPEPELHMPDTTNLPQMAH